MEPPPLTSPWIPRKYTNTGYEEKSKLFELQQKFNLLKSENENLKSQNDKGSQKVQGSLDHLLPSGQLDRLINRTVREQFGEP